MTEILKLTIDRRDGLAVIYTEGYINNQGGEGDQSGLAILGWLLPCALSSLLDAG